MYLFICSQRIYLEDTCELGVERGTLQWRKSVDDTLAKLSVGSPVMPRWSHVPPDAMH
jgi:hypothetical protein